MLQCWELMPEMRPTFSSIVDSLSHFLETMVEYMEIRAFASRSEPNETMESVDSLRAHAVTVFKNDNFIEMDILKKE